MRSFDSVAQWSLLRVLLVAFIATAASTSEWTNTSWDVIVVGSGPAGIIVATRMANAGLQTLLLEAGGPSYGITGGDLDSRRPSWLNGTNLTRVDVPGLYNSIFASSDNLMCNLNSYGGCAIGGSSAVNAGLFFEPPASDYDLYFPPGWKAKDLVNATQRLLARQVSNATTSVNGQFYLQSSYNAAREWIVNAVGFKDVGVNAQANNKTAVFGRPVYDYINGQRGGPVITYLQSALAKPNFKLVTDVKVSRVERDGERATGVVASINGSSTDTFVSISASGRVILSSGAIQSPGLLMHSGVGDPAILANLSRANRLAPDMTPEHWINSPAVGARLFDNPNTFIELSGPSIESYAYSYASPSAADSNLYLQNRSGPYAFAGETAVFWDTLTRSDGSVATFQGTIGTAGYGDWTSNNIITLNVYGTSGMKSSGSVVLDETSFAPVPDNKVYYSNPQDGKDIASFIHKILGRLSSSSSSSFTSLNDNGAMTQVSSQHVLTPLNIAANASVAEIESYITTPSAYAVRSVNHWSSSCRLGACVDVNTTAVRGVANLHVVDASIVEPLTVNPQFGVMVAAERASELILGSMGMGIVGV